MAKAGPEGQPNGSRWSASKKADVVVRLLRGESLDALSRELRVEAHRLQAWRYEFLMGVHHLMGR